jgi:hypothetical protein
MSAFHQDLDQMTRDMHDASLEVEYMQKTPLLNLILEQKNMKFKGGKRYWFNMDTDTVEDLAQDYGVNETLTHGTKEVTDSAYFRRKHCQLPIVLDFEEDLENAYETEDHTQLHNLAKFIVKKAQEGMRLHLRNLIYGAATDTDNQIQGLNSALVVDSTYGTLARTRASSIRDWWQPGDNGYTTGTQATATSISLTLLRNVCDPLQDLESGSGKLVWIMGPTLFLALCSEAEARSAKIERDPRGLAKFGIEEIEVVGQRIIKDPFLRSKYNAKLGLTSGAASALERRVYGLNIPDWYFLIHPARNFKMLPFFDQAQIAGGADFKLARIQLSGNVICKHPNRSIYFSNMVP